MKKIILPLLLVFFCLPFVLAQSSCLEGKYYCTEDLSGGNALVAKCEDGLVPIIAECAKPTCAIDTVDWSDYGDTKEEVCGSGVISNCGNDICESNENYFSCPLDCGATEVQGSFLEIKTFLLNNVIYLFFVVIFIILLVVPTSRNLIFLMVQNPISLVVILVFWILYLIFGRFF